MKTNDPRQPRPVNTRELSWSGFVVVVCCCVVYVSSLVRSAYSSGVRFTSLGNAAVNHVAALGSSVAAFVVAVIVFRVIGVPMTRPRMPSLTRQVPCPQCGELAMRVNGECPMCGADLELLNATPPTTNLETPPQDEPTEYSLDGPTHSNRPL